MTVTKKRRTIVFCLLTAVGVFGAVMVSGCGRAGGGGTPVPDPVLPYASPPVFVLAPGDYHTAESVAVTITTTEEAGTIRYTIDGSDPTISSDAYSVPFDLGTSATVKAIVVKEGFSNSSIASATYNLYWWQPLGGGPGTVNNFTAICSDASGNIYAGALNTAYPYRNFFKWDGNAWGNETSFNSIVRALAAGSGNVVYCGGDFDAITFEDEELLLSRVVKWTGTTWESLGVGVDVSAYALLISGGDLFAAGDFANAGGGPASNIAKWNGTSWSALGGGLDGYAYSLAADESGNIYAGGGFTQAGGSPASKIAKWDGSSWSALGAGTNGNVNALAAGEGGVLYAGGHFSSPGDHIAKWNGTSWSALPGSMSDDADSVNALIVDPSGNLYVGGSFTSAGGVTVNNIAKWNGTSWSAIGGGVNGNVNALYIDSSGNIYAGGDFTQAGGITVNKIAKWGKK